jgi:hypothetical protein
MRVPLWQFAGTVVEGDRQAGKAGIGELGQPVCRARSLILPRYIRAKSCFRSSAVLGHFDHPDDRPWMNLAGGVSAKLADVLGTCPLDGVCS